MHLFGYTETIDFQVYTRVIKHGVLENTGKYNIYVTFLARTLHMAMGQNLWYHVWVVIHIHKSQPF